MKNKFYTFEDLEFEPHPYMRYSFTQQALIFFANGYGVSVLIGGHCYGDGSTPYELAVLKGNAEKFDLCYDTPITNDVLGYLTPEEVTDYMIEVQKLERDKDEL
jgi:hypothetical protein